MPQRFAHILTWIVCLSVAVGACSNAESTRAESAVTVSAEAEPTGENTNRPRRRGGGNPTSDAVSILIREALQSEGSVSHRTLVQQLGRPQRVETKPVANQYVAGQVDTLRTFVYDGVEALFYDVSHRSKSFLVRLSLLNDRYATPGGLYIGLSEQRVLDELGEPTRREESRGGLIYEETDPTPISMIVRIEDDRVARIDWEFSFT